MHLMLLNIYQNMWEVLLKGSTTSDKKKARKYQDYTVINEKKGIYRLVMRSNKAEALDFQDWICDVLVELRTSYKTKRIWSIPHVG